MILITTNHVYTAYSINILKSQVIHKNCEQVRKIFTHPYMCEYYLTANNLHSVN